MKLILLESVDNLGNVGELVKVRAGYARNFLLPRGKAMLADERNIKAIAHKKRVAEHRTAKAREAAEEVRKVIDGQKVEIRRKAGENGKLFGSVTTMDIAEALREKGVIANRKFIHLEEPIKKTGSYKIGIKLDGGLDANVEIEVQPEEN